MLVKWCWCDLCEIVCDQFVLFCFFQCWFDCVYWQVGVFCEVVYGEVFDELQCVQYEFEWQVVCVDFVFFLYDCVGFCLFDEGCWMFVVCLLQDLVWE